MTRQQKPATTESTPATAGAKSLFERVAGYLDANEWKYSAIQEKSYFTAGCRIKDASVRIIIDVSESEDWQRVLVYSSYPVSVPTHKRAAVAQAIAKINYAMIYGSLEMDLGDGEVRVRTVVESDGELGDALMERALMSNVSTADRYFAPLLAVAFGSAVPETVLDLVARNEEATLQ